MTVGLLSVPEEPPAAPEERPISTDESDSLFGTSRPCPYAAEPSAARSSTAAAKELSVPSSVGMIQWKAILTVARENEQTKNSQSTLRVMDEKNETYRNA